MSACKRKSKFIITRNTVEYPIFDASSKQNKAISPTIAWSYKMLFYVRQSIIKYQQEL